MNRAQPNNEAALYGRRAFLQTAITKTAGAASWGFAGGVFAPSLKTQAKEKKNGRSVQTVLGPVAPEKLGATLMHEHAPIVDWSELYATQPAPVAPIREQMLARTAKLLDAFHAALAPQDGPGAIVETTPIRVGRYPQLLADLARQTKVHIIASTGFWCEALAPQHPWAVRMSVEKGGVRKMAALFLREIRQGMEDPHGAWGEKFTNIRAGVIKIGTSTYLRPSERACHIAAALASRETGCPITTHTTNGGGLEEAELLLKHGAQPERIIIGHQGHQDDRQHDEANEYHRLIAGRGCYVQFDRIGHANYDLEKQARQIQKLVARGFVKQVLVSHDDSAYYYPEFSQPVKQADKWKVLQPNYAIVPQKLTAALAKQGVSPADQRTILVDNPARVLAF